MPLLRLLQPGVTPVQVIREHLASRAGRSAWPSDAQVREAVATRRIYVSGQNKAPVRMLLMLAEERLRTDRTERADYVVDELTVEHLMPQGWRVEDWPIPDSDHQRRERERSDRARALHTLGNLTLVTKVLNDDVANGAWARKYEQLLRFSNLRLNQDLPAEFGSAAAIRRRGDRLADLL